MGKFMTNWKRILFHCQAQIEISGEVVVVVVVNRVKGSMGEYQSNGLWDSRLVLFSRVKMTWPMKVFYIFQDF